MKPTQTEVAPLPLARTERTLPIALLRAREAVMERFRPMLRDIGVTEQQWRVMRVLHEYREADASVVAHHACILAPSLTRIARTLHERGLLASERTSADGRRLRLSLTDAGRAFMHDASRRSAQIYAGIEADLGQDGLESLLDQIERLLIRLET